MLLTAGPTLVAISPNEGDVLRDNDVRSVAPLDLTFRFDDGQVIDASTLDGIRITQSGMDGAFGNANDVVINPGFRGIGEAPNEVVVRFAEPLPDDLYRIEIIGSGSNPLRNESGDAFNDGRNQSLQFELDLGAQIVAVVPQRVTRTAEGELTQARDQIVVYFNQDDLDPDSAENPRFYQLIFTNDTATNTDDVVHRPTQVDYRPGADMAVLTFARDLEQLSGAGTYRLRVGTSEAIPATPEIQVAPAASVTSDLNTGGAVRIRLAAVSDLSRAIRVAVTKLDFGGPGLPTVSVEGSQVAVVVNTNNGNETTAQQLVDAINGNADRLIRAQIIAGNASTDIASPQVNYSPLVLKGLGSSFSTATDLGVLGSRNKIVSSTIDPQFLPVDYPGSSDEPGNRDVPIEVETHLVGDGFVTGPFVNSGPIVTTNPDDLRILLFPSQVDLADPETGISQIAYNFRVDYGFTPAPENRPLVNAITPQQKLRAREVFELYGSLLGIDFVETQADGITVATGDMRALNPNIPTGRGDGIASLASFEDQVAILDAAEVWNDAYGASDDPNRLSWFQEAMKAIGTTLGLGSTDEQPPGTIQGSEPALAFGNDVEPDFPGDIDIVHGQHLHRPEGNDIDVYRFQITASGLFTAETFAERRADSSLLDTALSLYRETESGFELVARNDDYFSQDSYLELLLDSGTYFVGVSSTGNTSYDPAVEGTGSGGTSEGPYDLRLSLRPEITRTIEDTTGTAFDGDADGLPGGVYDFWLRAEDLSDTIFVDKSHTLEAGNVGTLSNPYNSLPIALSLAAPGTIVRVVGNGGADGDMATLDDNLAYEVGFSNNIGVLSDGDSIAVPRGVTMMVDAGAVFKMRRSTIRVGSNSPEVDRSRTALQVLGIPDLPVVFTSYGDESIGVDTNPASTTPSKGDWGGVIFRNDLDRSSGRFEYEQQSIFLNYVNHADIRYGGGSVVVNSVQRVITPIHMTDARPTISFNTITLSADAAMSANPDSFEETNFHAPNYQTTPFTSDYRRIGPDIHGNRLVDPDRVDAQGRPVDTNNTVNGLFVRIQTPAGSALETMTVSGRWDDVDIVHVVEENLQIEGTAGGPIGTRIGAPPDAALPDQYDLKARTDARLRIDPGIVVKLDSARIETTMSGQFIAEGAAGRNIIFTSVLDDAYGAGGTFDTTGNADETGPAAGDWGGIYVGPLGSASIDYAVVSYGGGLTRIEGNFAGFNALEIHQAEARVTNSVFQFNESGTRGQVLSQRAGRGFNERGTIFIRGAQPIIVDNIIRNGDGPAINVNANALDYELVPDYGRTTGPIDRITAFGDNQGPLIRGNQLADNFVNGMEVRGETLTTQGVWDDTDMVHVVYDTIYVPDYHTYGGLRLESSPTESLVVKLSGTEAGFTATGRPLDIDDRIGGALQIVGEPGQPVVLTSLSDSSVGAGFQPDGTPQVDTSNENLPPREDPVGTFRIDLKMGPLLAANPDAVASARRAAAVWESFLVDPITVVLDVEFGPVAAPALAFTTSEVVQVAYNTVRDLVIADAGPHESIVNQIPVRTNLKVTLPDDPLNPYSVSGSMEVNRANAKALGRAESTLPPVVSAYDPFANRDATITVSDTANVPGTSIFLEVLHEIGHALGFLSGVEDVDNGIRNVSMTPLDFFRLAPGDGQIDFTNSPRVLDPEFDQVFYDGGLFNPRGIPIDYIDRGDIPLSTGANTGDGYQSGHWKDPSLIQGINVGMMSPTGGRILSAQDRRAFDLIGYDVVASGSPGDWQSIRLDPYSNDRNVEVVSELEPPDVTAPGVNATPEDAEFIGKLAAHEKDGDDNLRLGFEVHGFLSAPGDVDVYSFDADAQTEVWLDIDRSTSSLDTVVELVATDGTVLARSDNSVFENEGATTLVGSASVTPLTMAQTPTDKDHYTTNPWDAGMRLRLPGPVGTTHTYHVRVRSSHPDVGTANDDLEGGLTAGVYQLNVRLRATDEIPGSTVRYADIRFATNGVELLGQPGHSPLLGEVAESDTPHDTFATAQPVGNPFTSDRGAVSIAGSLDAMTEVDWYQFDVAFDSSRGYGAFAPVILDLDYADVLGRPDASLWIFDESGSLVVTSRDSGITDDQPSPLGGADIEDLSRGSAGSKDPFIGPIELPVGSYYVAVTSNYNVPADFDQYTNEGTTNPLLRIEPIDSLTRIVDNGATDNRLTTFDPPVVDGAVAIQEVPFRLTDVVLYVSDAISDTDAAIHMVDPFTGILETRVGNLGAPISDLVMRPAQVNPQGQQVGNGDLFSMTLPYVPQVGQGGQQGGGQGPVADSSTNGNYIQIDPATATILNTLGDDNINTFVPDPNQDPPVAVAVQPDEGVDHNAMVFMPGDRNTLFTVAARRDGATDPLTGGDLTSILYMHTFQDAQPAPGTSSATLAERQQGDLDTDIQTPQSSALTNARERGVLDTVDSGTPDSVLVVVAGVDLDDGVKFTADDGRGTTIIFELDSGPEIEVDADPSGGATVLDGQSFTVGATTYEFDTGPVLVLGANSGAEIQEGETFTLTDARGTVVVFQFDKGAGVPAGRVPIKISDSTNQTRLVESVVTAITAQPSLGILPTALGNRITLIGDGNVTSESAGVQVEGAAGGSAGAVLIPVEETSTTDKIISRMLMVVAGNDPNVQAATADNLVNFQGATTADFSGVPIFTAIGTAGIDAGSGVAIPFLVSESVQEIASTVDDAVSDAGIRVTALDKLVVGARRVTFADADRPLQIAGEAPGGIITGLAFVGEDLYAVSDAGGLYLINEPTQVNDAANGLSATADYIETAVDLLGIPFAGLTIGPPTLENGRFAETLFAVDNAGTLYAFDTTGKLLPVFASGQSSALIVADPPVVPTGLSFSTLDTNLWQITDQRRNDPGHGVDDVFNGTRTSASGETSYYFGARSVLPTNQNQQQNPNQPQLPVFNYDFPGGAQGALVTEPIDLSDYSPEDQPVLYFNYFLDTEAAVSDPDVVITNPQLDQPNMRDSFRVYVSDNSDREPIRFTDVLEESFDSGDTHKGQWRLVATNNGYRTDSLLQADEYDNPLAISSDIPLLPSQEIGDLGAFNNGQNYGVVQELFDNTAANPQQWRQARVSLAEFAGSDSVRIKFEFATAGTMDFGTGPGSLGTGGSELVGVDAVTLEDGDTFWVDDMPLEFDLGIHLNVSGAGEIPDGEVLIVDDGMGTTAAIEFGGPGHTFATDTVPVRLAGTETADDVALKLEQAMVSAVDSFRRFTIVAPDTIAPNYLATVLAYDDGETLVIDDGVSPQPLILEFDLGGGVADPTHIPIPIAAGMLGADVAGAIETAIQDSSLQGVTTTLGGVNGNELLVEGPVSVVEYELPGPNVDTLDVFGAVRRAQNRLSFEGDVTFIQTVPPGETSPGVFVNGNEGTTIGIPVPIHVDLDARQVARAVAEGLGVALGNGVTEAFPVLNERVNVTMHFVTNRGPLGLGDDARDTMFGSMPDIAQPPPQQPGQGLPGGGQQQQAFTGAARALDNQHEGVYIDDLVIGFAGRGETVTNSEANDTAFIENIFRPGAGSGGPGPEILVGAYQLEIRMGTDYGASTITGPPVSISGQNLVPLKSFDINERFTDATTLVAPAGAEFFPDQSFWVSDGTDVFRFELMDRTVKENAIPNVSNDLVIGAVDSGLNAGSVGTYVGIGAIGDNTRVSEGLDVDLIAVDLKSGDVLDVDVDAFNPDQSKTSFSKLDSFLIVFDQSGRPLASSNNNLGPGESPRSTEIFLDPFVSIEAPEDGTYYVGVSGRTNTQYSPTEEGSGRLAGAPLSGAYKIQIDLNGGTAVSGNVMPIPYATFDSPITMANRIADAINDPRVQQKLGVTASASLDHNNVELFGDIVVVGVPSPLEAMRERNDTLVTAVETGITGGEQAEFRGDGVIGDNPRVIINPNLDVDLVRMALKAGDVLTVDVDLDPTSPWDPALRLFDASGRTVATSNNDPAPGEPASTVEPFIEFTVPADAVYYVGVSISDNTGYNPRVEQSGGTSLSGGPYTLEVQVNAPFDRLEAVAHDARGDRNIERDQGQVLVRSNRITASAEYGIVVDAAPRDGTGQIPHSGPVRNLLELNTSRLVPGATVANNVLDRNLSGGILISGDANPAGLPLASVPFSRVVNNTIYGRAFDQVVKQLGVEKVLEVGLGDVGIRVEENASPTLLNNILANLEQGIFVDTTSRSTVLGGTLFQNNLTNANTPLGDFPILLREGDPLFVNPDFGNFYLEPQSRAIDSSIDSLEDRPGMVNIRDTIGISLSPILVPDRDVDGQLRVDDPSVEPPIGVGENVFKDRGALDRADFIGPTAELLRPRDNDSAGQDRDPRATYVLIFGTPSEFSIQLFDRSDRSTTRDGTGADDTTVTSSTVTVTQAGAVLEQGSDYRFDYDTTNNIIRLTPLAGIWLPDVYVISLDNSSGGIHDKAGNPLNANQPAGQTRFTIELGAPVDFGDAPDPSYPTRSASNGASHVIRSGYFLGAGVDAEIDGQPSSGATGDGGDEDGVRIDSSLVLGVTSQMNVTASIDGFLDAWMDFNRDGDWNDAGEQVLFRRPLLPGDNRVNVTIPSDADTGATYARFRFSSMGGLAPTGRAEDGEVEDYQVEVFANVWHNQDDPLDVDAESGPSPFDALLIISELNNPTVRDPATGRLPVPAPAGSEPPPFLDVNGDGYVSPIDALLVINELTRLSTQPTNTFAALSPADWAVAGAGDTSLDEPGSGSTGSSELVGVGFATAEGDQPASDSSRARDFVLTGDDSKGVVDDTLAGLAKDVSAADVRGDDVLDDVFAEELW